MRRKREMVLAFEGNDEGLPKVVREYCDKYRALSQVLDGHPEALGRRNGFAVLTGMIYAGGRDFGVCCRHKFKEDHNMTSKEARERKLKEIQEIAAGWGKVIAREAFPDGPGLDVTLAEMEELAAAASRALVQGAVETMTGSQGEQFGQQAPCPICGRMCILTRKSRPMAVRGGDATLSEPVGHCPTCRRDFFPAAAGVED
jgi:hypothetical protein